MSGERGTGNLLQTHCLALEWMSLNSAVVPDKIVLIQQVIKTNANVVGSFGLHEVLNKCPFGSCIDV